MRSTQPVSIRRKWNAVLTVFFFMIMFLPLTTYAQTTDTLVEYDYTKEINDLSTNYDKILDYQDTKRCLAYSDKEGLNCTTYEDAVIYLYKTDTSAAEEVVNKNTVRLSDNTFKIYGNDAFYQDEQDNTWKQTEYGVVEKNDFQAVQDYELKNADVVSFLNNPFKIYRVHAQSFYSGSGDGFCDTSGLGGTWAANHDASASPAGRCLYSTNDTPRAYCYNTTWLIQRGYLPFDTSALADTGYYVSSSTLMIKQKDAGHDDDNDGNDFINVVSVNPASDNSLTVEDFDQWGTTEFSTRIDLTGKTGDTWWKFVLNNSGTSTIDFQGWTNFGIREGHDLLNTECNGGSYTGKYFYNSETSGTASDPYLLVELTEEPAEEEEPTATTTLSSLPPLPLIDDLTVITGRTDHYESSTTAADWSELHYYRVPAFLWWILTSTFLFILGFILSQIQRILRKKK